MRSAVAALLIGLTLTGCGGSDDDGSSGGGPPGGPTLDNPIELADCTDWNEGTVDERLGTIRQIRAFISGPVPGTGGGGVTLDDERAYDIFEEACSSSVAQGFTLYKLYVRAAAFSPESRSEPPQN
ncbi:MAG: hypothetical protein ACRDL6_11145 [Solirubrobacterales bacterium]